MIAVSMEFKNVFVVPYDVGMARAFDNPKRVYKYGQIGVPDLLFIGSGGGVRFGDIKTGVSGLSREQRAFKKTCLEVTGKDLVTEIRGVSDAIEYLKKEFPDYLIRSGKR